MSFIVNRKWLSVVFTLLLLTLITPAPLTAQTLPENNAPLPHQTRITAEGMLDDFERGIWLGEAIDRNLIGFAPWGDSHENVTLAVRQLVAYSDMAVPGLFREPNNVLMIAYDVQDFGGFSHLFTDGTNWISMDWTGFNALSFWLYGNQTDAIIRMEVFDNRAPNLPGDTAERWFYNIPDDYQGWRQFTIPFALFERRTDWQPDGAPNDGFGRNQVWGYAFSFPPGVGAHTAYLDQVALLNVSDTTQILTVDEVAEALIPVDDLITWDSREWVLVWSDEFEGDDGSPPDSTYWTHETGGHGWGNRELQYYTDRVENAALNGQGQLAITAREENPENYWCHYYGECLYTSARIKTYGKLEFTYGRVEARIQLPRGQGIWPAFWMLGANFPSVGWPHSGEIDIMEHIGSEPRTVHGTIHGPGYSGAYGLGNALERDTDLADNFHVFAVDWDEDAIRWYIDGELYHMVTPNDIGRHRWVYDHDFYLILNVAVGGNWPQSPDDTTQFPQTMLVDYVRVYQLAD